MTEEEKFSLAWNTLNVKDDRVKKLEGAIERNRARQARAITISEDDAAESRIESIMGEIERLHSFTNEALQNNGSIEPLLSELGLEDHYNAAVIPTKQSRPFGPRGLPVAEICSVDWPIPDRAPSIDRILDKLPKWAAPACQRVGRAGKSSHLWNPALLALCLATTTSNKPWACKIPALDRLIRAHFDDYQEEWEVYKQSL